MSETWNRWCERLHA